MAIRANKIGGGAGVTIASILTNYYSTAELPQFLLQFRHGLYARLLKGRFALKRRSFHVAKTGIEPACAAYEAAD